MKRRDVVVGREARGRGMGYWREQIRACEASGLSIVGYCRQQGLSASGYHWWKRRLKGFDASGVLATAPVAGPFAEVAMAVADAAPGPALEVVTPGGRAIRVWPGFDAETLARALDVVEGLGC